MIQIFYKRGITPNTQAIIKVLTMLTIHPPQLKLKPFSLSCRIIVYVDNSTDLFDNCAKLTCYSLNIWWVFLLSKKYENFLYQCTRGTFKYPVIKSEAFLHFLNIEPGWLEAKYLLYPTPLVSFSHWNDQGLTYFKCRKSNMTKPHFVFTSSQSSRLNLLGNLVCSFLFNQC